MNREEDILEEEEDILGEDAVGGSLLDYDLIHHGDADEEDHIEDFPVQAIDDPSQKSTKDKTDHSTVKKKHYGGYLYGHNQSLTTTGLTRIHFAALAASSGRKSIEDLRNGSEILFKRDTVFLSRTHLRDALWSFGCGYFGVSFEGRKLVCACGHKQSRNDTNNKSPDAMTDDSRSVVKKSRGPNRVSIKVNCPYSINFQYEDKKNTDGPVYITSTNHVHQFHDPTDPSEYECYLTKSHSSFTLVSDKVVVDLAHYLHGNPFATADDLRAKVVLHYPNNFWLSSYVILNLRNRINRIIMSGELDDELETYHETVLGHSIFKELDLLPQIHGSDVTQSAGEQHRLTVRKMILSGETFALKQYLEDIAKRDRFFTFAFSKDNSDRYNGVVWMSGIMRRSFELYGSAISLDMMKRELVEENWCYVAITSLNEYRQVTLCIEGMVCAEDFDGYKFVCSNLMKMAPGRSAKKVYIVTGDGYFSQQIVNELGFTEAMFISDIYHLREALKKNLSLPVYGSVRSLIYSCISFPSMSFILSYIFLLTKVKTYIDSMIYAETEAAFNDAYDLLKQKLPPNNSTVMEYVQIFANERATYAKYLISSYVASNSLRGSNSSEQNHSSIIHHIKANQRQYKVSMDIFARDLFQRQKKMLSTLNGVLSEMNFARHAIEPTLSTMDGYSEEEVNTLIRAAFQNLNLPSFQQFMIDCSYSKKYMRDLEGDMVLIRYMGMNANDHRNHRFPKVPGTERCLCNDRKSRQAMCKHEIRAYGRFIPEFFEECHRLRKTIERSDNIGSFRNEYQSGENDEDDGDKSRCADDEDMNKVYNGTSSVPADRYLTDSMIKIRPHTKPPSYGNMKLISY